jgi:hypothetical protein
MGFKRIFESNVIQYMQNNTLETLLSASYGVLKQLRSLALALSPQQYSAPLDLIHGNTIGKHYRHVIEFYQCLLQNGPVVNYDRRKRDIALETGSVVAIAAINDIVSALQSITVDDIKDLAYEADFSDTGGAPITLPTSFERELAYNIEHAVHHMAILQMVVNHYYTDITLEDGFGVAASTLRYQQQTHVHSNFSAPGA